VRRPGDITCAEVVELVTDYLEGALDVRTIRRVEAHLAACDGCTAYVEQVRQTVAITGRVEPERLPQPLRQGLREAFRGWRERA
jgi:anti-sigma factor RsiW